MCFAGKTLTIIKHFKGQPFGLFVFLGFTGYCTSIFTLKSQRHPAYGWRYIYGPQTNDNQTERNPLQLLNFFSGDPPR